MPLTATLADIAMNSLSDQKSGATEITLPETIIGQGPLSLSDIKAALESSITDKTQAKVTWKSSTPATSQVEYGFSDKYGFTTEQDSGLNSVHTVILPQLKNATTYHYKVSSTDQHGITVTSTDQTLTTPEQSKKRTLLEQIADSLSGWFNRLSAAVRNLFSTDVDLTAEIALAASNEAITNIHVVDISTPDKQARAVFWPANLGNVNLERSEDGGNFVKLDATDKNFYVDYAVTAAKTYTYRVGSLSDTIKDEVTGKSIISGIKIESGIVTDRTASIIVTFVTDKLAMSQVLYGRNGVADQKTELDESLNQSHTALIGNLKPNTAYSFFLRAIDKSGALTTDSPVQNFTTPPAPVDPSLLEIIIKALQSALAGFGKLFTK